MKTVNSIKPYAPSYRVEKWCTGSKWVNSSQHAHVLITLSSAIAEFANIYFFLPRFVWVGPIPSFSAKCIDK